jgi:prepilin-type N-terminal cleavage/methylation domain-containing protein
MVFKDDLGFTFIELVIVVLIIALLAVIAVPVYNNFSDVARINADKETVSILNSAIGNFIAMETISDVVALKAMSTGDDVLAKLIDKGYIQGPISNINISRLLYKSDKSCFSIP